jgi:hypothetical protein
MMKQQEGAHLRPAVVRTGEGRRPPPIEVTTTVENLTDLPQEKSGCCLAIEAVESG